MIWTGLVIGFLGSLHCVGMCGPLVITVPGAGRASYQAGRIFTYSFLGLIFGAFGQTLAFAGWQRGLSIAAGIFILAAALGSFSPRFRALAASLVYRYTAPIKRGWGRLLGMDSSGALFAMGLLNGLLPCGLVYVGLAAAAASGAALSGAGMMALFGVGTLPALLVTAWIGKPLRGQFRLRLQRAVPVALLAIAALLIVRGLGLGIPYVSPDFSSASCCAAHR